MTRSNARTNGFAAVLLALAAALAVLIHPCSARADCSWVGVEEVRCDRASFTGLVDDLDAAEAEIQGLRDMLVTEAAKTAAAQTDAKTALEQARLTMQVEVDFWKAYATQQAPCPPPMQPSWWDKNRPEIVFVTTTAGTGGLVAAGAMIVEHKDIKVWGPTLGFSLLFESVAAWAAWSN